MALVLAAMASTRKQRADLLVERSREESARVSREAARVAEEARRNADAIRKEAEIEARERRLALEDEMALEARERRRDLVALEQRLGQREESLDRRAELLDRKEFELTTRTESVKVQALELEEAHARAEALQQDHRRRLEGLAHLTSEAARAELMRLTESEARQRAALAARRIEDEAVAMAEAKARSIIGTAVQRISSTYGIESTVTVLDLPSDEMKGRIIGREGRNIRALERATGVDLIVDDTPEAILISSFDAMRREVARLSLAELIRDGRIHPARIEEAVAKARRDVEQHVADVGRDAVTDLGFADMHPELVKVVGRMKFRTSYGQNILLHSREVAFIAGAIAAELGANVEVARRGGFLHDLGKAIDREVEGTHTQIGVDLARRFGERPDVIHCIEAHHMDVEFDTVEAMIVQAADALSAARPGARREILETYIKRLEKLEGIASTFRGVAKSYAIQAGREIRILVEADKVGDEETAELSREIARKIEGELQYPGHVKVTVIREVRAVDYAR
jgi:ribonuclease Y